MMCKVIMKTKKKNDSVFSSILKAVNSGKRLYWILLDPDHFSIAEGKKIAKTAQEAGADSVLVGGSLLSSNHFDLFVKELKKVVTMPVILFPGDASQLSAHADALLYLSLVSGRNPVNLIGEHVKAAPMIQSFGLEPISTAYMLIESGAVSSVEFMSNTRPLPRAKAGIAAAHALAAEYMGMKLVYLEAGSGAPQAVPPALIRAVKKQVTIPVIVGGGIRSAETAAEAVAAGADIIVTGNLLQQKDGVKVMREIAAEVHKKQL